MVNNQKTKEGVNKYMLSLSLVTLGLSPESERKYLTQTTEWSKPAHPENVWQVS